MESNRLPEQFFNLLGKIVVTANVCDNLLLHIIDYEDKAKSEKESFGKKIEEFTAIFNEEFKQDFNKLYPNNDLIRDLIVFSKIRNAYVHGIPFVIGNKIGSMKISKELVDNDYNATDEIIGYTIQELQQIIKNSGALTAILEGFAAQKHPSIRERYNRQ